MSYITMALGWVLKLCCQICSNYGLAIIIFTILIKAVLLPLSVKQQRSMLKTQKLQPLLMEIQRKYANDKEKQQQETMKLYQKYQVNPMSGCLPLLIQLPILMMLYFVVKDPVVYIMGFGKDEVWRIVSAVIEWSESTPGGMETFLSALNIESIDVLTANNYKMFGLHSIQIARFLSDTPAVMNNHWITELGKNLEVINFDFLGLDLSQMPSFGKVLWIFTGRADQLTLTDIGLWCIPLLSGFCGYISSKVSQAQAPQPQKNANGEEQENPMKGMMTVMPLMSAWFAFTLPSAVGLYWIISNIIAMVQQVVLNKIMKSEITDEQIEGEIIDAKKNRKKRKK